MNTARKLPPVVTASLQASDSRPGATGARPPVSEADARRRRPGTGVACLILLGITLGALGHVAVHLQHYEVALALGDARRERAALEERRRQLSLEIGVYKDPMRVMEVARTKLGLSQPSAADIVPASELGARLAMRAAGEASATPGSSAAATPGAASAAAPGAATRSAASATPGAAARSAAATVPAAPTRPKATATPPVPVPASPARKPAPAVDDDEGEAPAMFGDDDPLREAD